jgi:hypothetical protein
MSQEKEKNKGFFAALLGVVLITVAAIVAGQAAIAASPTAGAIAFFSIHVFFINLILSEVFMANFNEVPGYAVMSHEAYAREIGNRYEQTIREKGLALIANLFASFGARQDVAEEAMSFLKKIEMPSNRMIYIINKTNASKHNESSQDPYQNTMDLINLIFKTANDEIDGAPIPKLY